MADIKSKDNPPTFKKTAAIDYEYDVKTGSHIYTSAMLPGLLVVCKSQDQAKDQLKTVIRKLIYLNKKIDCSVEIYEPMDTKGHTPFDAVITEKRAMSA